MEIISDGVLPCPLQAPHWLVSSQVSWGAYYFTPSRSLDSSCVGGWVGGWLTPWQVSHSLTSLLPLTIITDHCCLIQGSGHGFEQAVWSCLPGERRGRGRAPWKADWCSAVHSLVTSAHWVFTGWRTIYKLAGIILKTVGFLIADIFIAFIERAWGTGNSSLPTGIKCSDVKLKLETFPRGQAILVWAPSIWWAVMLGTQPLSVGQTVWYDWSTRCIQAGLDGTGQW